MTDKPMTYPDDREIDRAVALALRILDRINADPDDDLALLSRQLLRSDECVANLGAEIDAKDAEIARLTAERDEATGKALRAANACVWNDFEVPISELDPGWIVGSISERINKLTPPLIDLWDKLRLVEARKGEAKWWEHLAGDSHAWHEANPEHPCPYCAHMAELDSEASALRQQIAELEGKL